MAQPEPVDAPTPPVDPPLTNQQLRHRRILDAAREALEEQEYEQIQVRDVAAAAGVALGTLYRYFSSKEHLYAAVLLEWAQAQDARPARRPHPEARERVRHRLHAVVRTFQRQPQFFKVHVLLQSTPDDNARRLIIEFGEVARQSLAEEFDMLPGDEAADVAMMVWSIIHSMTTQVVYHGLAFTDVHRVLDRFVDRLF